MHETNVGWALPTLLKTQDIVVGDAHPTKGKQLNLEVRSLMDAASYEAHLMQTAFRVTAFLLLTYGPLQVAAIVCCKRWLRAVAVPPRRWAP
jgi:hypothetical protein